MSAVLVMSSDSYAVLGHLVCTVSDTIDQERHLPSPKEDTSPPQSFVESQCVKCQQPYNFRFLHCFALERFS